MPTNFKNTYFNFALVTSQVTVTINSATALNLLIAPSAPYCNYIKSIYCSNSSATETRIDIQEGSTTKLSMTLAASGGGFVAVHDRFWMLNSATALQALLTPAVTDVYVNLNYFVNVQTTKG